MFDGTYNVLRRVVEVQLALVDLRWVFIRKEIRVLKNYENSKQSWLTFPDDWKLPL